MRGTRPSTLRVYQFRHRRVATADYRAAAVARRGALNPAGPPDTLRNHVRFGSVEKGGPRMVDLKLTRRQQEIFDFIKRYSARHGYPPTVRDIGTAIGLTSSSTVHAHLANLERIGLLRRDPTKPRALELLVKGAKRVVQPAGLPVVGRVAAGEPILADENIEEYVNVPPLAGGETGDYLLRVAGDSMRDGGILDGDR